MGLIISTVFLIPTIWMDDFMCQRNTRLRRFLYIGTIVLWQKNLINQRLQKDILKKQLKRLKKEETNHFLYTWRKICRMSRYMFLKNLLVKAKEDCINRISARVVSDEMTTSLDVFPTIAAIIANSSDKSVRLLDGVNILPYLRNPQNVHLKNRPFIYYGRNGKPEAISYDNWKLHIFKSKGWHHKTQGDFPISLYNLINDPGEEHNLAGEYPRKVKSLEKMLARIDKNIK
ncbi:hypothetical protein SAMN05216436_12349 [bacterium A37T11]|nr:hypothetical protein SAMN05216436_12349 [bacterium A37T11]